MSLLSLHLNTSSVAVSSPSVIKCDLDAQIIFLHFQPGIRNPDLLRNAACDELAERKRSERLRFFLSEVANTESAANRWRCAYACVMFSTHQAINCASLGLPVPNLSPLTNASAARTSPRRGVSECSARGVGGGRQTLFSRGKTYWGV